MTVVKVPKLIYDEIEVGAFAAECCKLQPPSPPKFALKDVVHVAGNFGRTVPAMIGGYESRDGKEWTYHIIRPRDYDGGLERVIERESKITAIK